ncbi:MAG: Asp-tRNA(Asn)/Glu-tRNA(Gln) amidotransferase subunit GatC [Eggerthellaceae bacterium]|nr:Asp-tRNA(Asn)/Glu-tRNA(Gln) amidotransferase subunit GatC [Eggerthellaceae bacterium]
MQKHLSEKDVAAIAEYVRIGLLKDELATLIKDLNDIIDSLAPITAFDLEGVEPTFHPIGGLCNVMREDVVGESLSQAQALANAARTQDGCFVVPTILGGGELS